MSDPHLHKIAYFKNPKLDMSLTPALADTFAMAAKAGRAYLSTVMLLGETGVGKTSIARHIHDSSTRSHKPFQVINLSQATPSIFESEFFGHEKGSFTGAHQLKKSPFELADGGTVFLDEIGTLSFELQARLLRLVEERTFKRVGGNDDITVDVRILVATSLNLEEKVRNGEFREDLYHRLNVLQIYIPPLRDRQADIIPLAEYFLTQASASDRLSKKTLSDEAKKALQAHGWTGNVRTLENEMKRATILTDGDVIEPSDLSFHQEANNIFVLRTVQPVAATADKNFEDFAYEISKQKTFPNIDGLHADAMRHLLASTLEENDFSKERTARKLRTNANTMSSRILTYLNADKGGVDAVKSAVEQWNIDKAALPHIEFLERLFTAVSDVSRAENRLTALDDIFYRAKILAIKEALIEKDFVQSYAATSLGAHGTTVSKFIAENPELKTWLHHERTHKPLALSERQP